MVAASGVRRAWLQGVEPVDWQPVSGQRDQVINPEEPTMQARILPVIFLLLLSLVGCERHGPRDVSERYWTAVLADDQATAAQYVTDATSPSLSTVIHPQPGSRVSFGDTQRSEQRAEVETTIHWVDGQETTVFETITVLVRENDQWKVDPAATRNAFFESVYRSALTGLEAILEDSARAFREFGSELSQEMARELSEATRELQEQSEKANEEIQSFLESLDAALREELERSRR